RWRAQTRGDRGAESEPSNVAEDDPVGANVAQARELACMSLPFDGDNAGRNSRLDRINDIRWEGASSARHRTTVRQREIRLGPKSGAIAARPSCERDQSAAPGEQRQASGGGDHECAVPSGQAEIDHT